MKGFFLLLFLVFASAALHSQDFKTPLKLASPRTNGDDVLAVQTKLLELGFTELGPADGWFGPQTQQAVSDFQRYFGLVDTGTVERTTWLSLFTTDKQLLDLMKLIKDVNRVPLDNLRKERHDLMGRTTEGGYVDQYFDSKLVLEDYRFFGEMGQFTYHVVYLNDGFVVLEKDYSYPEPFDLEHAKISNIAYYFTKKISSKITDGVVADANTKDFPFDDLIQKPSP